jgi:hypothetical protein
MRWEGRRSAEQDGCGVRGRRYVLPDQGASDRGGVGATSGTKAKRGIDRARDACTDWVVVLRLDPICFCSLASATSRPLFHAPPPRCCRCPPWSPSPVPPPCRAPHPPPHWGVNCPDGSPTHPCANACRARRRLVSLVVVIIVATAAGASVRRAPLTPSAWYTWRPIRRRGCAMIASRTSDKWRRSDCALVGDGWASAVDATAQQPRPHVLRVQAAWMSSHHPLLEADSSLQEWA